MKNLSITILGWFILPVFTYAQSADLFFSEYVEGSGNNKYIEIYNGTGASVNLSDYKLRLYANGATTPNNDVQLSGTLADGQVIVYRNSAATIYAGATTANAAINFNGDDALVLFKVSTNSAVDIFGNIGCDPGTKWTQNNKSTLDKTLRRKISVCSGITIDPPNTTNCPFPTLDAEWDLYAQDDISGLGSHTSSCAPTCATPTQLDFSSSTFSPNEQILIPPFSVSLSCTSGVASFCSNGFVTLSTSGCGISGTLTRPVVNGVATFNDIVFSRSPQYGIRFSAVYSGTCAAALFGQTDTFSVQPAGGTPTVVDIRHMNFSTNPIPWNYSIGTPTIVGSGGSAGIDVFTQGFGYLYKSYSVNNGSGGRGTSNTATFDNVVLNPANAYDFYFKIASVSSGGSGAGNDKNEDALIECSLDGGNTWFSILRHMGMSNRLFPFSSTPITTLNYNSNITYSSGQNNSSFHVSLPAGTTQFMFRFTATNNRENERWALDDVRLEETTYSAGANNPLPNASLLSPLMACPGNQVLPVLTVSDYSAPLSYAWHAAPEISDLTIANPLITVNANTTHTLVITDADGCKDSSTVSIQLPSGATGSWIGAVSTDWFDCMNWGGGILPDSTTDVFIGALAQDSCAIEFNSPLTSIPAQAYCRNITVDGNHLSLKANGAMEARLRINGNLNILNGAKVRMKDAAFIAIKGNWINQELNGFVPNDGYVLFNGNAAQSIQNTMGTEHFYGLGLSNLSQIDMYSPISTRNVDWNTFVQGNGHLFTIGSSVSQAGTLNYTQGYLNGKMRRYFSVNSTIGDEGLFPIGNAIQESRMARIMFTSPPAGDAGYLEISFHPNPMGTAGLSIPNPMSGLFGNSIDLTASEGFWTVQPESGKWLTSPYTASFNGENFASVSTLNDITLLKRIDALNPWISPGTHIAATGTPTNVWVSRAGLSGFSDFGFGFPLSPLPVKLQYFDVHCANGESLIKWTTEQEFQSDYFEILASENGNIYEAIAQVRAAGMSNATLHYSYVHTLSKPYAYWRLKQVDFNGDFEIFDPKYALCDQVLTDWNVEWQNGHLILSGDSEKEISWTIMSLDGKTLYTARGMGQIVFDGWSGFASGIYIIHAQMPGKHKVFKQVKP